MVAPVWLILCVRELGWGTVFLPPLYTDPVTGPVYSSSVQLGYKPLVYPVVGFMAACCVAIFGATKQYRTLEVIWQQKSFPVLELVLLAIGAYLSTEAEGHGFLNCMQHLEHGQQQLLEELAEMWAYIALLAAQWRVYWGLRR